MNPIDQSSGIKPHSDIVKPGSGTSPARTATSGAHNPPSGGAIGDESVTVTETASELMRLERQLAAMPDVDQQRIASLREAIADGSYSIDAERIVDALLRADAELS